MEAGERIRVYFAGCNTGDEDVVAAHFTPDAVVYDLNHAPLRGVGEIAAFFAGVRDRWDGATWTVDRVVADGRAAAIEWHMDRRAGGTPFRAHGSEHYSMADDSRIAEIRQYWIFDLERPGTGLVDYPYGGAA